MKIQANGIEMNYELKGDGNCLVLIHGYSDNLNMWYNQVPKFAEGYRVLAYDVRGFGKTDITGPYSMGVFADDLHGLLRALDIDSACVLGYSMGGRIGLDFTLRYPEMVTGLVFANSGIGGTLSPDMEEQRKMMVGILKQGNIEVVAELMAAASFSPGFQERNPSEFQSYKDVKLQNDLSAYIDIMQALMESMDAPPDLGQLKCPVLIIAGDADAFMEVGIGESMKDSIENATLKMFPTGHAAAIEVPEDFNRAVLDFLKGLTWPE